MVSEAARELGRLGGRAKSAKKTAAVRQNASRPRGKWVTAISYTVTIKSARKSGLLIVRGKLTQEQQQAAIRQQAELETGSPICNDLEYQVAQLKV